MVTEYANLPAAPRSISRPRGAQRPCSVGSPRSPGRSEMQIAQDGVPAVPTFTDWLDVELVPPDIQGLVETVFPADAHQGRDALRHVPAAAHVSHLIAPAVHTEHAQRDGTEVEGHEGRIAVLERSDRDDPQLTEAEHRKPRHDVVKVMRLAHTHRHIVGLFRDARSLTVEVRGITQMLHDFRVGVAELGTQVPVFDALAGRGIRLHPLDTG